jgi:hypothetical protein
MWGSVTRADLERLDALIKDRSRDYRETRRLAQAMKDAPPFSESFITLHPKIDSTGQRRLQCSLPFAALFDVLASDGCAMRQPTCPATRPARSAPVAAKRSARHPPRPTRTMAPPLPERGEPTQRC